MFRMQVLDRLLLLS